EEDGGSGLGHLQVDRGASHFNRTTIVGNIFRYDGHDGSLLFDRVFEAQLGPKGIVFVEDKSAGIPLRAEVDVQFCTQYKIASRLEEKARRVIATAVAHRRDEPVSLFAGCNGVRLPAIDLPAGRRVLPDHGL